MKIAKNCYKKDQNLGLSPFIIRAVQNFGRSVFGPFEFGPIRYVSVHQHHISTSDPGKGLTYTVLGQNRDTVRS